MDFELTAEEEALRAAVRRFLADRAPTAYVRRMLDDPAGTTPEVWRGLADLGVVGLLATSGSMTAMGVVLEELGRAVHPGPFLASAVGALSAVALADADDELVAALGDGRVVGTVAPWDAGTGWSWRNPGTTADASGRLTGVKRWVPDAAAADVLVVTARTGGELALFAVDRSAPGVDVESIATPDGTRRFTQVTLRDVPGRRLGVGDATDVVAAVVDRLAIAYAIDGLGAADAALAAAVAYGHERVQFDRPIGSFQAVQHLCADMLRSVELARAACYYALWAADAAPPEERHRAAVMCQAFCSDALPRLGADVVQVFAGIGYTWEHDAHLFLKRLLSLEHALGGAPEHLEELASLVI